MLKNLLTTLRRYAVSSTLNIVGLMVAFATFTLLMMQTRWEYAHGKSDQNWERVYRLDRYEPFEGIFGSTSPIAVHDAFVATNPQIEVAAKMNITIMGFKADGVEGSQYFSGKAIGTDTDLSKIFDFQMISGSMASITQPKSCLLSQSLAQKIFGDKDPIGQSLNDGRYTVTGVYKDMPTNSTLLTQAIFYQNTSENRGFLTMFVKSLPAANISEMTERFANQLVEMPWGEKEKTAVRLINIGDLYFDKDTRQNSFYTTGDRDSTNILTTVAILVLLIAFINFTNFYMALAPVRARGLNTRLVFGSTIASIRRSVILEGFAITFIAFGLSLFLVEAFRLSPLVNYMTLASARIEDNLFSVILCGVIAVICGTLAGCYQAYFCTKLNPAAALKGVSALSFNSRWLNRTLVGVQFVISISLIICAIVVRQQHSAMINAPLGFNKEGLLTLNIDAQSPEGKVIKEELKKNPSVIGSAFYNGAFGQYDGDQINYMPTITGDTIAFYTYYVDSDFLPLLQMPIVEGRNIAYRPNENSSYNDKGTEIVLNRKAQELFGLKVDSLFDNDTYKAVGIVENCFTKSVAEVVDANAYINSSYYYSLMIRIDPNNVRQTINQINATVARLQPNSPSIVEFFDDIIAKLYTKQDNFAALVTIFSLLSIFISLIGVFGLVMFETQQRKKEIALRKINGATVVDILSLLNKRYIIIIAVCFAIAVPMTYFTLTQWLAGFAYQAPLRPWVFAAAGLIVMMLTMVTVTLQSIHTATTNPIRYIKKE